MADDDANKPANPELFLLSGDASLDELMHLFKQLTRRLPTLEEAEEASAV